MSKKCNNYKKRRKYTKIVKEEKIEKRLVFITIILSVSQIFGILYPIFSNLYGSVDEFLRKTIMYVLLELPLAIITIIISIIFIFSILRYIHIKFIRNKENSIKEIMKNNKAEILAIIILFIEPYVALESIIFSYDFKETEIILIGIIFLLASIFIYLFIKIIFSYKTNIPIFSSNNKFSKNIRSICKNIIEDPMTYKIMPYTVIIIVNALLISFIKIIDYTFIKYENKIGIEKQIKDDKEIKYQIIIDKLLDKVDINVTDEEIKNEKIKLIEKYKLEESIKNKVND